MPFLVRIRFKQRFSDLLLAFKQKVIAPGPRTGRGLLVLEPADYSQENRRSWFYSPNLRRVFRAPYNGLDTPALNADGLRLSDEFDMFNGTPYLFEWKLLGKREIYVPYNAYRLHSDTLDYAEYCAPPPH